MTVLLISFCNAPPPPPSPAAADGVDCCAVKMLVGSVVETVSVAALSYPELDASNDEDDVEAAALTASAAAVKAFVVVDDVSAGVWVVVSAAVTFAAVVTIFEHIVDPSIDGVQNVFSLSALGEETST